MKKEIMQMLELGNSLNREYRIRVPFMNGFCNLGIFMNPRKLLVLFSLKADVVDNYPKVQMNRNLQGSMFCEKCIELYSYQSKSLDIRNQFNGIKKKYDDRVSQVINETVVMSKVTLNDKELSNRLELFGFTIVGFDTEYLYLIAERQHINVEQEKKLVRTCGIEIASSEAIDYITNSLDTNTSEETTKYAIAD